MKDYFEILGIDEKASEGAIQEAYRKLAKKFHPDLNQGDEFFSKHFILIQEAYDVLSDDNKRKQWIRSRANTHASPKQDISAEIDRKIFAYRKRNASFCATKQHYQNHCPMQEKDKFWTCFGYGCLGVGALIILIGFICLVFNPTLTLKQLCFQMLWLSKYLAALAASLAGIVYFYRYLSSLDVC